MIIYTAFTLLIVVFPYYVTADSKLSHSVMLKNDSHLAKFTLNSPDFSRSKLDELKISQVKQTKSKSHYRKKIKRIKRKLLYPESIDKHSGRSQQIQTTSGILNSSGLLATARSNETLQNDILPLLSNNSLFGQQRPSSAKRCKHDKSKEKTSNCVTPSSINLHHCNF